MLVGKTTLDDLLAIVRKEFTDRFSPPEDLTGLLTKRIPMTGKIMKLWGLKAFAKFRKWIGARQRKNLAYKSQVVTNFKYEDTLSLENEAIEDNDLGSLPADVAEMAHAASDLRGESITEILEGSNTENLGYDGLVLGSASHAIGDTTYSNVSTDPLTIDNLATAEEWFTTLVDDAGKKIVVKPTHLITSGAGTSWRAAKKLMKSSTIVESATTQDNINKGDYELLKLPWLASNDWWALAALDGPTKPVIYLTRTGTVWTGKVDEETDETIFYARLREGMATGNWMTIRISTGLG